MANEADDDWRLRGPTDYLVGVELEWISYSPPSPTWDHDHCEFCWAKFMDVDAPDVLRMGYKTITDNQWICESCFADFKSRFKWVVKP